MALGRRYDKACPIFNYSTRDAGVLFPFVLTDISSSATTIPYIDFSGTLLTTALARLVLPFPARVITCQAIAVTDGNGLKTGAATAEPIITIGYGTNPVGSVALATIISTITCDGAGPFGTVWTPGAGTTQVTLETGQEICAYLNQTCSTSDASGLADGGAKVIVWIAQANATD
jgi:hypothetical protein